jgi:RsiW-degrading membrane proteinase PrsW (M82 family)
MYYPIYIFFGILPSVVWLLFYLRSDVHPEPKSMVLKIFFFGMLSALPAVFIEKGISEELKTLSLSPFLMSFLNNFIGVAAVEEGIKYLVVRGKVLKNPAFDEPIDAMLYMIIAALGFAAVENILILLQLASTLLLGQALLFLVLRFLGATLLHALSSAVVGFWLAHSFIKYKTEKLRLISIGLLMAVGLHGLYNFFIMKEVGAKGDILELLAPIAFLLTSLALFVSLGLERLKRIKIFFKHEEIT